MSLRKKVLALFALLCFPGIVCLFVFAISKGSDPQGYMALATVGVTLVVLFIGCSGLLLLWAFLTAFWLGLTGKSEKRGK